MTAFAIILAVFAGAAWRRWFGSDRPRWVKSIDAWWRQLFVIWRPDRGAPYRGAQIALGAIVLTALCYWNGDQWWRAPLETAAAIIIMTASAHTRDPFIWIAEKLRLPKMWGTFLDGPAPWSEALQGATLWTLAVAL